MRYVAMLESLPMRAGQAIATPGRWFHSIDRLALPLFVFCIVACGFSRAQEIQGTGQVPGGLSSIHGTVLNKVTGEPVGGALVYSSDERYATLTDDHGKFHFEIPPREPMPKDINEMTEEDRMAWVERNMPPMVFRARKPGYLEGGAFMQPGAVSATNPEITINLDPESLIVGRVTMPDTSGEQRIHLELFRRETEGGRQKWAFAGRFTTWSNGEFRFFDLPAGTYKLMTQDQIDRDPLANIPGGQQYGFPPVYFPAAHDFSTATTIQLKEGETFQADLKVIRSPYYRVRIPVLNAGAGRGMMIYVYPLGSPSPGYSLGYNPGDQSVRGMLPDGDYTLEVENTSKPSSSGVLNFSVNGTAVEGPRVVLVPNASLNVSLREELESGQSIISDGDAEGDSNEEKGSALRRVNLQVTLWPMEEFGVNRAVASVEGDGSDEHALSLPDVPPGRYLVMAEIAGGYAAEITEGETDLLRQPLTIGIGGSYPPIEITVRDDGAEVEGTIEDSAGQNSSPVQNGNWRPHKVYFLPVEDDGGQFREADVQPDGSFEEDQLPPGTYLVVAFDSEQGNLRNADAEILDKLRSRGQVIELSAGETRRVNLKVIHEGDLP
jgi:hypothetical protein